MNTEQATQLATQLAEMQAKISELETAAQSRTSRAGLRAPAAAADPGDHDMNEEWNQELGGDADCSEAGPAADWSLVLEKTLQIPSSSKGRFFTHLLQSPPP